MIVRYSPFLRLLLVCVLAALFSLCPAGFVYADTFAGGSGDAKDPYLIETAEHLRAIASEANSGKHYKLIADIELSGNWTPIGTSGTPFTGMLDGNHKKITGLKIDNATESYQGLFGYLSGGTVKGLGIESSSITTASNKYYAGGIAGYMASNSSIEDCYVTGAVSGGAYVGGITGYMKDTSSVKNCYSTAVVTGTYTSNGCVGGIVGYMPSGSPSIENCYSTGAVTSNLNIGYVGGVAGHIASKNVRIINCAALNSSITINKINTGNYFLGYLSSVQTGLNPTVTGYYLSKMETPASKKGIDGTAITEQELTEAFWRGMAGGEDIWLLKDGEHYPQLKSFTAEVPGEGGIGGDGGEIEVALPGEATITIRVPENYETDDDGIVTLPEGGKITLPGANRELGEEDGNDDITIAVPAGTTINPDAGTITLPKGGKITLPGIGGNGITIGAPEGTTIDPQTGVVTLPDRRTVSPFAATSFFGEGIGESPYKVSIAEQLAELAGLVNSGNTHYASAYYELTGDIDAAGSWIPIGTKDNPFKGRFDGRGHKIGNPSAGGADYVGLFGYVSDGVVRNLGVENASFTGGNHVGGIAGYIDGNIANCYVTGSVAGASKTGGIAGALSGSVSASYSAAGVTGSGDRLGGIAGEFIGGSISNCYSTGAITNTRTSGTADNGEVGGIVGGVPSQGSTGSVTNCYSTGVIIGFNYVGGIAGNIYGKAGVNNSVALNPQITCNAKGGVTGTSDRVFAYYPSNAVSVNNYALSGMECVGSAFNLAAGGGADVTAARALETAFWTDDAKWSEEVWILEDGKLPKLRMPVDPNAGEPAVWFGGTGTAESPYLIRTAADLANLAALVNDAFTREYGDKHYALTADIDLSDFPKDGGGWVPIGINRYYSFRGTFDGGNHTVSGLSIDRRTQASGGDYEGLFGYVYMGTVKNLTVSGKIYGWFESGGIAGYLEGNHKEPGSAKIENCHSAVSVYCWGGHAGGVAGYVWNGAVVENCSSSAIVEAQKDELGGIAGLVKSNSRIVNSCSTARVTGPVNRVGGIAGAIAAGSSIENCYSTGDISGADHLGGIAGYVISSTVKNSYSTGAVYGLADEVYIDGSTYSTSYKDEGGGEAKLVFIELGDYVGGVAGEVYFGSIENCYSTGPVKGHSEVGGLVGTLNPGDKVENSVAFNPSVKAVSQKAGRVVGAGYGGAVRNSYAYSGMTNGGGVSFTGEAGEDITVEQAKTPDFWIAAAKWNAGVWEFTEDCFPLLKGLKGQTQQEPVKNAPDPGGSNPDPGAGNGPEPDTGDDPAPDDPAPGNDPVPDPVPAPILEPEPSPEPGAEQVILPVPGGHLTAPPDTVVDPVTGVATLPAGGEIVLTDGKIKITVPANTTIDPATGIITIPGGGDVTLADGTIVIRVPPATTIDSESGAITVTPPEGGTLALPVGPGGEPGAGVEVTVPGGSTIDPKTGIITLPGGGRIIFSIPDGEPGVYRAKAAAADRLSLVFIVTPGTTVSSTTGLMTVKNGGDITLPDGSAVTLAPGATINPFTGEIVQPQADEEETDVNEGGSAQTSGSGGGCDAGAGMAALLLPGLAGAAGRKKRGQEA
jgi:hypothetical protein